MGGEGRERDEIEDMSPANLVPTINLAASAAVDPGSIPRQDLAL